MSVIDMSVIIYLIDLSVFAARIVHDHHIIVLKVLADEFFIERDRSILLVFVHELLDRFA